MNSPLDDSPNPQPQTSTPATDVRTAPPQINSSELLRGAKELLIQHGTETYRLRQTRSGKLILQK